MKLTSAVFALLLIAGCATPQERMKFCNEQANAKALKGEPRQAFMKSCLKA